jgi:hypothetical protein
MEYRWLHVEWLPEFDDVRMPAWRRGRFTGSAMA